MRTLNGQDLWDLYQAGHAIAITTNGVTRTNGDAVMGAGLARQAAERFPDLPHWLGDRLRHFGNVPHFFRTIRVATLPTKHHWRDSSDLLLIQDSIRALRLMLNHERIPVLYCPPPGCGLGGLQWAHVAQAIEPFADDRFVFVLPASART